MAIITINYPNMPVDTPVEIPNIAGYFFNGHKYDIGNQAPTDLVLGDKLHEDTEISELVTDIQVWRDIEQYLTDLESNESDDDNDNDNDNDDDDDDDDATPGDENSIGNTVVVNDTSSASNWMGGGLEVNEGGND